MDDFYEEINAEWLKTTTIPENRTKWGTFAEIDEKVLTQMRAILEGATGPAKTLYDLMVNAPDVARETRDLAVLIDLLDGIKTREQLVRMLALLPLIGVRSPLIAHVDYKLSSSCRNILHLEQGEVTLPSALHYTGPDMKPLLETYRSFLAREVVGLWRGGEDVADRVVVLETKLVKAFVTHEQMRDVTSLNNTVSKAMVESTLPMLRLDSYLGVLLQACDGAIIEEQFDSIAVARPLGQPDCYLTKLAALLESETIADWVLLLKWNVFTTFMRWVSPELNQQRFDFFEKAMLGTERQSEAWEVAVTLVGGTLGFALEPMYVQKHFDAKAAKYVEEMVRYIREAFRERMLALPWMEQTTRRKAALKLHMMRTRLGHPREGTRDASLLKLQRSRVLALAATHEFNAVHNLTQLNNSARDERWYMHAFSVNAYYHPLRNEFVVPSALLVPPMVDPAADRAINYAKIGAVIGHELVHGFDDQGRHFDHYGNLSNWWSEADAKAYQRLADRVVAEYESKGANGKLTVGENIADLGGVQVSLLGLAKQVRAAEARELRDDEIVLFFKSYAEFWRALVRPKTADEMRLTDPHAMPKLRVNVPVAHVAEFHTKVRKTAPPKDMISIW